MLSRWLLFLHILSAITFFLGHGAGAAMAFQLRKETNLERIRAMLDLSLSTLMVYLVSFLVLGITGIIMPFPLHLWNRGWVWLSIVLMLFVFFYMFRYNEDTYKVLRKLVGLPYRLGNTDYPADEPASDEEIAAHIRKIDLWKLVVVGYGLPGVVLWLMVFKPF
jgi:hypothetical protein